MVGSRATSDFLQSALRIGAKSLIACSTLFIVFSAEASSSKKAEAFESGLDLNISLDSHVHFTESWFNRGPQFDLRKPENLMVELNANFVKKALLISDGYREDLAAQTFDQAAFSMDANARVLEVVRQHPDRLIGLCGVSVAYRDTTEIAETCLNNPEMRGLKFHFSFYHESFLNSEQNLAFTRILEKVSRFRPIILIHMNLSEDNWKSEISEFFKITRLFRETTFVIAHSGNPISSALAYIVQLEKSSNLKPSEKKIFTEVSNVAEYLTEDNEKSNALIKAWRKFGISRVLFGSDAPITSAQLLAAKIRQSNLTSEEKDMILVKNGNAFLRKLNSQ